MIFDPVRTKAMTKILSYWRFLSCLFLYTFFFINFDNWLIFSCNSSKTVLLHFQMCCYDSSFGFIINSIPTAGSMLTANPFVDPSTYYNDNVVPKENCCDLSDNCRLYYDARPVGRCYFRSPFAICKYFLNAGKHRHSWHGITPPSRVYICRVDTRKLLLI